MTGLEEDRDLRALDSRVRHLDAYLDNVVGRLDEACARLAGVERAVECAGYVWNELKASVTRQGKLIREFRREVEGIAPRIAEAVLGSIMAKVRR